jgi:alpha-glucoside transport system permease protein
MTMQKSQDKNSGMTGIVGGLTATLGRILISFFVPVITFLVLWQVFIFLRDSEAPQIVIVLVAIIWGVAGVALLYVVSNWFVELPTWPQRLQPFVYVGPAVVIMGWYLAVPVLRTLVLSFKDDIGVKWVGFDNYIFAFRPIMRNIPQ